MHKKRLEEKEEEIENFNTSQAFMFTLWSKLYFFTIHFFWEQYNENLKYLSVLGVSDTVWFRTLLSEIALRL